MGKLSLKTEIEIILRFKEYSYSCEILVDLERINFLLLDYLIKFCCAVVAGLVRGQRLYTRPITS